MGRIMTHTFSSNFYFNDQYRLLLKVSSLCLAPLDSKSCKAVRLSLLWFRYRISPGPGLLLATTTECQSQEKLQTAEVMWLKVPEARSLSGKGSVAGKLFLPVIMQQMTSHRCNRDKGKGCQDPPSLPTHSSNNDLDPQACISHFRNVPFSPQQG